MCFRPLEETFVGQECPGMKWKGLCTTVRYRAEVTLTAQHNFFFRHMIVIRLLD